MSRACPSVGDKVVTSSPKPKMSVPGTRGTSQARPVARWQWGRDGGQRRRVRRARRGGEGEGRWGGDIVAAAAVAAVALWGEGMRR